MSAPPCPIHGRKHLHHLGQVTEHGREVFKAECRGEASSRVNVRRPPRFRGPYGLMKSMRYAERIRGARRTVDPPLHFKLEDDNG